jgi:hypothetical protein
MSRNDVGAETATDSIEHPKPCPYCGRAWARIGFMEWELTCECPEEIGHDR